jgi:hypothetical protein
VDHVGWPDDGLTGGHSSALVADLDEAAALDDQEVSQVRVRVGRDRRVRF